MKVNLQSPKRIIINTFASYGQSVFAIVVSLFTARWTLHALGQVDYGLFGVVGSLILLVTFLTGGLSVGVSRFYAYSIGQEQSDSSSGNSDDLKRWFNTAFSLHTTVPLLLVAIGWPLGEYAIQNWLTIPEERVEACLFVFHLSLVSGYLGVFAVPFLSMFKAHQLIYELAFFGIIRSCASFVVAWSLLSVSSDRLIFFATCMMAINVFVLFVQIVRACIRFDACRVKVSYLADRAYFKKLFGYVGWKMFGMSCVALRQQGGPILINVLYGPIINAAYSVSNRVSMQATTLSTAMTQAFQPALISAEGKGDRTQVLSMSIKVCKFGSLLVLIFAIPLILEMETLLVLWLVEPPNHAVQLCQWMVSMLVVDRMTSGPMLAVNAYGKIAVYELVQGTLLLMALPFMALFYWLDLGPDSIGYALFLTMSVYCIGRIVFARRLLSYPVVRWLKEILLPVFFLIIMSAVAGAVVVRVFDAGFVRIILTSMVTLCVTVLVGWFNVLDGGERCYVYSVLEKKLPFLRKANSV